MGPDDRTITHLLSSQLLTTQGSADPPAVGQAVWGSRHIFKAGLSVFQQLTAYGTKAIGVDTLPIIWKLSEE